MPGIQMSKTGPDCPCLPKIRACVAGGVGMALDDMRHC